jgi:NTP pyrophosphatase (non-canonical NTP hydrolase)
MTFEQYMKLNNEDFNRATAAIVEAHFKNQDKQTGEMQVNDKICRKIINMFGTETMLNICMEEPAELIQAISKMRRLSAKDVSEPIGIERRRNLVEEIADVSIILTELMIIYGIKPHEVQTWIEGKQIRSKERIRRAEEEGR